MNETIPAYATVTRPTDVLKQEHRVIEKVLDAVERELGNGAIDKAFMTKALDFFRNYADGCHHAKEECELFPALESAGIPREGGPIGCMLSDHEAGRSLIRTIAEHLDAAAGADVDAQRVVRHAATTYVELLRQHIQKEDNVLFVMADQVLGTTEQAAMLTAFDAAEHASGTAATRARYVELADELSEWSSATAPERG